MMAQMGAREDITPRLVDWLLYNLPSLKARVEAIEPRTSTSLVTLGRSPGRSGRASSVEQAAIRRAALSAVLDAVERGVKALRPDPRRVYRLRYRAGMSRKEMRGRLYLSEASIGRRLAEVREVVASQLEQVPASERAAFTRHFRSRAP